MLFCKCGKILSLSNNGLNEAFCSCGFRQVIFGKEGFAVEESQAKNDERKAGVVEEKHNLGGFPHICSKCGYDLAEVYDLGISYSDEAAVYLFKCKKCGWSERQSDGTGN